MGKQWDKIFKKCGKVFTKPQENISKITKLFKKKGVKKVLDLGCGSGINLVYLAKHGFEVYGIDNSPTAIKIAKNWIKEKSLKADLKINNIYKRLPYKDNLFDAVISIKTIHHARIKNIRKATKEIERVLKPGGLLFITVRRRRFNKKTWSKYIIDEKYEKRITKYKVLASSRAYIPLEGGEKGLIHYLFNKKLLKKEFRNFKIYDIWVESDKRHYCLLGELKSK